jgi:cyclase
VGDPVNTVRLWSEFCVDEIVCLDISETREKLSSRLTQITAIIEEAFVPVAFGGGIDSLEQAHRLFDLGIEKVVIGWEDLATGELVDTVAAHYGSQAVACCLDYSYSWELCDWTKNRRKRVLHVTELYSAITAMGRTNVGEIILQCVDREGEMNGLDLAVASEVHESVDVPLVLLGGVGSVEHIKSAHRVGCSAGAGSLFTFRTNTRQVLLGNPLLNEPEWTS